ncbi:hypothetical protein NDI49_11960 [Trichocoleus sp. ST-U3]|uniref:hypothetical protein n=1 Tax=Coleofasciculus sp. FACHB-542 TaxID=2692787 RepID=UPI001689A9DA|nr:hypothetical protein [Coleofasciculus sp. FACHB-542]MBD2084351.1 hypothetical protein [Coleofasciculus sp. FACHB-542]
MNMRAIAILSQPILGVAEQEYELSCLTKAECIIFAPLRLGAKQIHSINQQRPMLKPSRWQQLN